MVQRALAVSVVAYTLMAMATSIWHVVILRAAIGIFGGFYSMTLAYLVTVTPPSRASIAIALLQGAQILGTIAGPVSAGFIADHYGLRASFFTGAAVVAVGFFSLLVLADDDRAIGAPGADPSPVKPELRLAPPSVGNFLNRTWHGARDGMRDLRLAIALPGFGSILGALFLTQMVDRSYGPILPLFVAHLGTPDNQVASFSGLVVSLERRRWAYRPDLVGLWHPGGGSTRFSSRHLSPVSSYARRWHLLRHRCSSWFCAS